jgi:hypothetical protein
MKTKIVFVCLMGIVTTPLFAQFNEGHTFQINLEKLKKSLAAAPDVFEKNKQQDAPLIGLPLPDGRIKTFRMFRTQPMHPGLAVKYPDIHAFHGKCKDDDLSMVALTFSPAGLNAMIQDEKFQRSFIEPSPLGGNFKLSPKPEGVFKIVCHATPLRTQRIDN